MQVSISTKNIDVIKADLFAFGVTSGKNNKSPQYDAMVKSSGDGLKSVMSRQEFSGKTGQKLNFHAVGHATAQHIALFGIGAGDTLTAKTLIDLGGDCAKAAIHAGAKHIVISVPEIDVDDKTSVSLIARGLVMGSYRFEKYRSEPRKKAKLTKATLVLSNESLSTGDTRALNKAARDAIALGEGVCTARDLVNEPPGHLYPETFANRAEEMAKDVGLSVKVFKPTQLKKMKMNLLLGVGQGSAQTPRLVHLSYIPKSAAGKKAKPLVLVGKGITFDSGGLCLKPPGGMVDMKIDMGGAAAVFGAMEAIGKLKPNRPVHGLLALAENMPSGTAIRTGDVITGASGRTVEINNTDAEGRLVMADTLHYAVGLKPARIIDLATLTGACMVALGPHTVGMFTNDDDLAEELLLSSEEQGEHFWRMPLTRKLKEQLKSDVADTKNTGERFGGAITAALFLSEFVANVPWAHLDIAGPAATSSSSGATAKGGTGVGVATLVHLALNH